MGALVYVRPLYLSGIKGSEREIFVEERGRGKEHYWFPNISFMVEILKAQKMTSPFWL